MPSEIKIDDGYAVEESTAKISIGFTDEDGLPATPSVITWTLTDESGNVINNRLNENVSSPASSVDIALKGDDLAFQANETGDSVYRIFLLEWTYSSSLGADLPGKDSLKFPLVNLVAV